MTEGPEWRIYTGVSRDGFEPNNQYLVSWSIGIREAILVSKKDSSPVDFGEKYFKDHFKRPSELRPEKIDALLSAP
jgi:hypothetical protein